MATHPSFLGSKKTKRVRWSIVETKDGYYDVEKDGHTVDPGNSSVARAKAWIKQRFTDGDSVTLIERDGLQRIITRQVVGR